MQLNWKVKLQRQVTETIEVDVALNPNSIPHKNPNLHWLAMYALEVAEELSLEQDWKRTDTDTPECLGVFAQRRP